MQNYKKKVMKMFYFAKKKKMLHKTNRMCGFLKLFILLGLETGEWLVLPSYSFYRNYKLPDPGM